MSEYTDPEVTGTGSAADPLPQPADEVTLLLDGLISPAALFEPDGEPLADARTTKGREQRARIREQYEKAFALVTSLARQQASLRQEFDSLLSFQDRMGTEHSAAINSREETIHRSPLISTVCVQLCLLTQRRPERITQTGVHNQHYYRVEFSLGDIKVSTAPHQQQVTLTAKGLNPMTFNVDAAGNFDPKELFGLYGYLKAAGIEIDTKLVQLVMNANHQSQTYAPQRPTRNKPGSYQAMLDAVLGGLPGQDAGMLMFDLGGLVPPGFEKYLTEEPGHYHGEYPYNH